jgi:hypothetical protein
VTRLVLALIVLVALVAGCSTPSTQPMPIQPSSRFKVERVGVIEDDLAYGSRRGIYLITDTETGKTYVGVSGVGISDVGSHQVGKTRTRDER